MNGGGPPRIIHSVPSAEMISDAVAQLHEQVQEEPDLLAPAHPPGILKSGASSPRYFHLSLILFSDFVVVYCAYLILLIVLTCVFCKN